MIVTPDTNLLIHAHDSRDPLKQETATGLVEIMGSLNGRRIANQVVGEFFNAATRKLRMTPDKAATYCMGLLEQFPDFSYESGDVNVALQGARNGAFSYWDGLLLASAVSAGCELLISEDLQDGFRFEQLSIITPFASDGSPNPQLMDRLASS